MPKIFDRNIDAVIFLISLLVIFALVKALTLLPSRYYFTFSQIVGPQNQTQFLASPELPSPAAFCRALHVKESESQIRETVSLTEREVELLAPCGELNAMHDVQYQVFYTYDIVDGQHLNSDGYNAALDRLISFLKNNEAIIKGAMLQNGVVPENSLSNLTAIDIENNYDPALDPHDVSSSFPAPPDIALRRYADHRLRATGDGQDTLKFVIEDSRIHRSLIQPAGKFTGWLGVKRKDLYEVAMKIRLYTVSPTGQEGTHSILNMRRSISIPHSYSVAEQEHEKSKFLEMLMQDVDDADEISFFHVEYDVLS